MTASAITEKMDRMRSAIFSLLVLFTVSQPVVYGLPAKQPIRAFDFKKFLLGVGEYGECPETVKEICKGRSDTDFCPLGLSVSVSYADLTGDGIEEAIVQGSSCFSGTAGPDIHSVYTQSSDRSVRELKLPQADNKYYEVLFGNRNYDLKVENGRLVAVFGDTSGRPMPLVIRYKWGGDQFQVDSVRSAPMFKTSYDCMRGKEEHERAICYVASLAALDVKLDALFKKTLQRLPSQRSSLIQEERRWIEERNKKCTIYKWWVECLTEEYKTRLSRLQGK